MIEFRNFIKEEEKIGYVGILILKVMRIGYLV